MVCGGAPHRFLALWLATSNRLDPSHRTDATRGVVLQHGIYNSTVYNAEEPDPRMEAVGSHLNALVRLGITVANDSPISLGLGVLHTSNGGVRRPNKGINTPQAKLIVRLVETPRRRVYMDGATPKNFRSALVWDSVDATMQRTAGTSTAFKSSSPKPRTSCPPAMASRPKRRSSTTEPCADPNTDASSDTLAANVLDRLQPGLSAGWSWMFGRARLDLIKGAVLVNPTPGSFTATTKRSCFSRFIPRWMPLCRFDSPIGGRITSVQALP